MAPKKKCWSCILTGKPTLQKVRADQGDMCQSCYGARRCNFCQMDQRQDKNAVLAKCKKTTCNELALWCAKCNSSEALALQQCQECLPKRMQKIEVTMSPKKSAGVVCWLGNPPCRKLDQIKGTCVNCATVLAVVIFATWNVVRIRTKCSPNAVNLRAIR